MIKIEVRIRQTVDQVTVEHEYRAELPDTATAEQIAAVGREAQEAAQVVPDSPAEQGVIHIGNRKGAS